MKSNFPALMALLILLGVHGALLSQWAQKDERTLAWDQAIHTRIAFEYKDRAEEGGVFNFLRPVFSSYPPLYHFTLIPFLGMTPDIADAGVALNFIYLAIIVFSVFFIARRLTEPWPAFTAAVLISCYPIVIDMSRQTMIDIGLTAWVCLGMLFLLKSENFTRTRWSIAFGVALGLGVMTKWTMVAYLAGPFLFCAVQAFRNRYTRWMWVALLIAAGITAPWMLINGVRMVSRLSYLSGLIPASGKEFHGIYRLLWYPVGLFEQMNLLFVLFLVPGLAIPFWRPKFWPIALWFFVSLMLFSLIRNNNVRYTLPALPAAAILSVAWLPEFRRWPFVLMNAAALAFVGYFYFGPTRVITFPVGFASLDLYRSQPAEPGSWKHQEIINTIRTLKRKDAPIIRVLVVSNAPHLHSSTLNTTLAAQGHRDIVFRGVPKGRWFDFAEFVLTKTGNLGPDYSLSSIQPCADLINAKTQWFVDSYHEKARWPLPDGTEAVLYQFEPKALPYFHSGSLEMNLEVMQIPKVKLTGVRIKAVPISPAQTSLGRLQELVIDCQRIETKDLDVENVRLRLIEPQINVPYFLETQEIQPVTLKSLEVSGDVPPEPLLKVAARKAKWLKDPQLEFSGPRINITGQAGGVPVQVRALVQVDKGMLISRLESLTIKNIPFPLILIRALTDQRMELKPVPEKPFELSIKSIEGADNILRIRS